MTRTLWHNGTFFDPAIALFTAEDRIRLGHGVFDSMLAQNNEIFFHDDHLDRLLHDINVMALSIDFTTHDLKSAAQDLLKSYDTSGRFILRTLVTANAGPFGFYNTENAPYPASVTLSICPAPPLSAKAVSLFVSSIHRNETSPLSRIKSINYGDSFLGVTQARQKGYDDALFMNTQSRVCCGTTSNIMAVIKSKLTTPPLTDGVLNGITRKILLDKYDGAEKSLSVEELKMAECVFLTNSVRHITPISQIDDHFWPNKSLEICKDFSVM